MQTSEPNPIEPSSPAPRPEAWTRYLHTFALSSLAIAQPLLDLLAGDAEFFVVRRSSTLEIVLLVFTLMVVVPLPLVALTALASRVAARLGDWVHNAGIGALSALMAYQTLTRLALLDGRLWLVAGIAAGGALAWAYHRFTPLRMISTYLGFALVAVPAVFLLDSRILKISFGKNPVGENEFLTSGAKSPVIFLVFDEFSLTSLLDEDRQIDPVSYPNLANFAQEATWFPQATTVSNVTVMAVPAILTGKLPVRENLPILEDHAHNLFTALGGDYKIWASEPITQLCPPAINTYVDGNPGPSSGFISLYSDLWTIYQHLVLPPRYAANLPVISDRWQDFRQVDGPAVEQPDREESAGLTDNDFFKAALSALRRDRQEDLRRLVAAFDPDEDQALYFLHILLPHAPWEFLPSGKSYSSGPTLGLKKQLWDQDEGLVLQGYQRYLMQVQFIDLWFGRIVQRLRDLELYDKSLIVFAADHGVSFRPGDSKRAITDSNHADLIPIPLLIKAPYQQRGQVVDRPVSTIDILPSVLDLLEVDAPWQFHGHSVFDAEDQPSTRQVIGKYQSFEFDTKIHHEKYSTLDWKVKTFQGGSTPSDILRAGTHPELFGKKVDEIGFQAQETVTMSLQGENLFRLHPTISPAFISGTLKTNSSDKTCCDVAVAVNGTLHATVRAFGSPPSELKFTALVPDAAFREEGNHVQIFRVRQAEPENVLELLGSFQSMDYALVKNTEGAASIKQGDHTLPVKKNALRGYVSTSVKKGKVSVWGWAIDVKAKTEPKRILVFYRGDLVYGGFNSKIRQDMNKRMELPATLRSGFHFSLPLKRIPDISSRGLQLFAVSDHAATELGFFYKLVRNNDGRVDRIQASDGRDIPVAPAALSGYVDQLEIKPGRLRLAGWAADKIHGRPAERIVVFIDDKLFLDKTSFMPRKDVAQSIGKQEVLMSGFNYQRSYARSKDLSAENILVFAISQQGQATLLPFLTSDSEP